MLVVSFQRGSLPASHSMGSFKRGSRREQFVSTPRSPENIPEFPGCGKDFVIPSEPPMRDQWVPDYKATVCMACQQTQFSMVSIFYFLESPLDTIHYLVVTLRGKIDVSCWELESVQVEAFLLSEFTHLSLFNSVHV